MAEKVKHGTWVEIQKVVLATGQRAPQVPEDTLHVPLEMRVKGMLVSDGSIGEEVEIKTATGRHLRGILAEVNPAYTHSFGAPLPELISIGNEVRALLQHKGSRR